MTELIAVITITLLAVISPGPDFAMVTRNSLMLSRRAGVLTALAGRVYRLMSLYKGNPPTPRRVLRMLREK